jgi:hypothetical protein
MSELPPEALLWNLSRGALGTEAFGIAADLGVADALAAGPGTVSELAEENGADRRIDRIEDGLIQARCR